MQIYRHFYIQMNEKVQKNFKTNENTSVTRAMKFLALCNYILPQYDFFFFFIERERFDHTHLL